MDKRSNRLAHYIIRKGIKARDLVGVALNRSPEILIALLAIMKAGAAYIPLDPEFPADRIAFILADASAKMLITSIKYAEEFNDQTNKVFIETALAKSGSYSAAPPAVIVSP